MDRPAVSPALCEAGRVALAGLLFADLGMLASDAASTAASHTVLLGVARLALVAVALSGLFTFARDRLAAPTLLGVLVAHDVFALAINAARGRPETTWIVAVMVCLGAATLLPWGWRWQSALVLAHAPLLIGAASSTGAAGNTVLVMHACGAIALSVWVSASLARSLADLVASSNEDELTQREAEDLGSHLEDRIQQKTSRLEEVAIDLGRLCQSASHDLRPPLRTIAGFSEILRDTFSGERHPAISGILVEVIALARTMGTKIDLHLRDVREIHARLAENLVSPAEIAASEFRVLTELVPSCRCGVETASLTGPSSLCAAALLRNLLRFVVLTGGQAGLRSVDVGTLDAARCVRARGWRLSGSERRTIAEALDGTLTWDKVPPDMRELVTAARAFVTAEEGRVWLESEGEHDLLFLFREGSRRNVAPGGAPS